MKEVVGIKEQNTNQISYIYTDEKFEVGDMLIVDNGKGQYIFECVRSNEPYNKYAHKITASVKVSKATSEQLLEYLTRQEEKLEYKAIFNQMIKEFNVNAMLIDIDFSLDGDHLKYTYFSIDKLQFPKMIKYLLMHNPSRYKVEFYQVGEREYYAINGGIGVCGYELCCHSRSHNTPTITTNSLKSMGIDISMKKSLTGTCGKYQCCLLFEPSKTEELKNNLPDLDSEFIYLEQLVTVTRIDLEKQIVTVIGNEIIEIKFDYFVKGINVSN
ncbi:regulatory iron-sulfur-containing complex subunit RicT [Mollicutes bacterium LVI A0039]|nr:regulatory iron-sulfur-containing complex subunit RicT [Mollicutes bacterium LVI A0039]